MATVGDAERQEMSEENFYDNLDDIISGLVNEKLEGSGWVEGLPPGMADIERELGSLEDQQARIQDVFQESEQLLGVAGDNLAWQQTWFNDWKDHNRTGVPEEMVDLTVEDDEIMVVSDRPAIQQQQPQQQRAQQQRAQQRQEQPELSSAPQAVAEVETPPAVPQQSQPESSVPTTNQETGASSEQPIAVQHEEQVQREAVKVSTAEAGPSSQVAPGTSDPVSAELAVGMRLMGKKKDDIWYQGTLIKIVTDEKGVIRYKVKYDVKGKSLLSGNHIAFCETVGQGVLHAGSRIVGQYVDEEGDSVQYLYAGIVAELPSKANKSRYLIFFDDGFATYLRRNQIHQVCKPSANAWEDVHPNSREFIREYLQGYPERAMVKVKVGQKIRTEWNGQWWDARVDSVDGSLVKMYYPTDKRSEWIYRGSTRLWPLYEAFAHQEQAQTGGSKSIRSHTMGKTRGPHIEYTRAEDEEAKSKAAGGSESAQKKPASASAPIGSQSKPPSRSSTPRSSSTVDSNSLSFEKLLTEDIEKLQAGSKLVPSSSGELQNSGGGMGRPVTNREAWLQIAGASQKNTVTSQQSNTTVKQTVTNQQSNTSVKQTVTSQQSNAAAKQTVPTAQPPVTTFPQRQSRPLKKQVARKSTGPRSRRPFPDHYTSSSTSVGRKDIASILQKRLMEEGDSNSRSSEDSVVDITVDTDPTEVPTPKMLKFCPHQCTPTCVSHVRPANPDQYRGRGAWPHINPLKVPILYQWERYIGKKRPGGTRDVSYRTPCARMLRNVRDISRYLTQTKTDFLSIDQFCFDPYVMLDNKMLGKNYVKIPDISNGNEDVPISCVNEINNEHPDNVGYTKQRLPTPGVELNLDPDYLVSCDCTDNCQNKKTCACHQLTIQAYRSRPGGQEDPDAGYENRRLTEQLPTGIYECNSRCKCSKQCYNRVAQNGIGLRLQVFRTSKRGWGIRCLDDIPQGAFICIYAGQLLTEDTANKGGNMFGDEYLAELDHIEIAEKFKEGYESDVPDSSGSDMNNSDSDSDNSSSGEEPSITSSTSPEPDLDNSSDSDYKPDITDKPGEAGGGVKLILRRESRGSTSGRSGKTTEQWSVKPQKCDTDKKVESWMEKNLSDNKPGDPGSQPGQSQSSKEDLGQSVDTNPTKKESSGQEQERHNIFDIMEFSESKDESIKTPDQSGEGQKKGDTNRSFQDALKDMNVSMEVLPKKAPAQQGSVAASKESEKDDGTACPVAAEKDSVEEKTERREGDIQDKTGKTEGEEKDKKGKDSSSPLRHYGYRVDGDRIAGLKRKHRKKVVVKASSSSESEESKPKPADGEFELMIVGATSLAVDSGDETSDSEKCSDKGKKKKEKDQLEVPAPVQILVPDDTQQPVAVLQPSPDKSTRKYFGEEHCYVMDAKVIGNCGRYLNHSCSPNLFVQNVFVDTHDLRFPWVAFFSSKRIRGGTELTWDYNYQVGSVAGKVLYCYCGSEECRGRLL
ncbi:histone-lysine N-methyltransferase SETDB1-like isoform X2 [Branchiostoma lanceolatum]|uniref:histone-lysine N-methyltransferase SETDB1-like isoform X2 n=1 Tax=Branchiostoma lanceolatum TaxID=7740 RepID=UPI0034535D8F